MVDEGKGGSLEGMGVKRGPTVCPALFCARALRKTSELQAPHTPQQTARECGVGTLTWTLQARSGIWAEPERAGTSPPEPDPEQRSREWNSPAGWSCSWKIPTSLSRNVLLYLTLAPSDWQGGGPFWQLGYSGKDLAFSEPLGLHFGMAKVEIHTSVEHCELHRILSTHLGRQGSRSPTFEKKACAQGHIAESGFKAYPLRVGLHVAHPIQDSQKSGASPQTEDATSSSVLLD